MFSRIENKVGLKTKPIRTFAASPNRTGSRVVLVDLGTSLSDAMAFDDTIGLSIDSPSGSTTLSLGAASTSVN